MKKLILALAVLCSMQVAYAQKSDADIQKNVNKAIAASQDAKKGAKAATWVNLGKAYLNAYNNPTVNIAPGIDKNTLAMMFREQPSGTEVVELEGEAFEKLTFSHVDLYFNGAGQLVLVNVTHPSYEGDLLGNAAAAYAHAFELGAKEKDIAPKMQEIVDRYLNDAYTAYTLGDIQKACELFKGASDVSMIAPCPEPNMDATYNTAFTALALHNYDLAQEYFNRCLANGYTSDGNIYANLAECAQAAGDTLAAKNFLADGMRNYPDNNIVLTNLINLYISTNEDPAKIVELLDEAKLQMPDNASLYYVEGNIYTGIKNFEAAKAAYDKAAEIDPNYDMAYYGLGMMYLKKGEAIVDEMNALDVREWRRYDELQAQLNETYILALEPLEKCYEVTQNPDAKIAAADFLKRLNFQLRNIDPKYQEAYDHWAAIVNAN